MNVHLKATNLVGEIVFEQSIRIDPVALMVLAESKEDFIRSKGRAFAQGAVPYWAAEAFNAAKGGRDERELEAIAQKVALAAWLVGSIYDDVSPEEFVKSNLHFTLLPGGAVKYDRIVTGAA